MLSKDFDLSRPIKMDTYEGRLSVRCGDLKLSYPEPEELDRSVRFVIEVAHPEVNFMQGVYLCNLSERSRPTSPDEGRLAIKQALQEFGAALVNI